MPTTRSSKKIALDDAPQAAVSVDDLVGAPVKPNEPKPAVEMVTPAEKVILEAAAPVAEVASPTPIAPVETVPSPAPQMRQNTSQYQANGSRPFVRRNFQNRNRSFHQNNQYGYRRPQQTFNTYNANPTEEYVMQDANVPTETVIGFLEIMAEGHGFLRPKFTPSDKDIYISQSQIRKFNLRSGDQVAGQARQPKDNERYYGLLKVEKINEVEAEKMNNRPKFDDLVPIYPKEQIKLESSQSTVSTRIIDLFAPIGFGQRGLIVSPPKAGKTTILKDIAHGISINYPHVHLMAALIGERPEEVTDISRTIKGEVIASHFDESPNEQTKVAEIALNRAKRLVEMGKDVVILLDSITRLARAYNLTVNSSGRTLSGGFDPAALHPAKRFLGAARKNEEGGSLTIIGTALVDTGSRMDDLIYEEFKGTGNMELHLNRALAEKRIFPAIDIDRSGTRQDQLLMTEEKMKKIMQLRNVLSLLNDSAEKTAALIERLSKTTSNEEFLTNLAQMAG